MPSLTPRSNPPNPVFSMWATAIGSIGRPAAIRAASPPCSCTAGTAWHLHKAWPGSRLIMVPDAGHAASEPGIRHHLVEATDIFARA